MHPSIAGRQIHRTSRGTSAYGRLKRVWALIIWTVLFGTAAVPGWSQVMTDDALQRAVTAQLMTDNYIQAQGIDVTADKGIITLAGTVDLLITSERAAHVTMTVKGVRAIVNRLAVLPSSRSDTEIRDDVRTALALDPVADAGEIDIAVRDGEVILTGQVDSWQEKKLVEIPAKGIPGVRRVVNRLDVEVPSQRSDAEMAAEIDQRLAWDVWVAAAPIEVAVTDGRVTLSGVVGSLAEKEKVAAAAWVSGVRAVDDAALVVDWERYRTHLRSRPRKEYTDASIERAVHAALGHDPRISPTAEIDVVAENGVVTLQGNVAVLAAARAAEDDARNTAGVWMVKNLLKVRPAFGPDYRPLPEVGSEMARKVRLALLLAPGVRQDDVTVTVNQSIAVLEGQVSSNFARRRAGDAAAGIRGVVTVVNRLQVVTAPVQADREDWRIRHDIESELRWSPFVDETDVHVEVAEGKAVLTGVVEDLRARRAATVNAREGGARAVENHLKVRHGPDFLRP